MGLRRIAALFVMCLGALAQAGYTVEQIKAFIRSAIQLKNPDKEVAATLRKMKLSERLDLNTVETLQGEGAGPRTVEAGEIIIAADRFRLRYRIPVAAGPGQDGAAGQDRAAEGSPAKDSAAQTSTAQTSTAQNGTAGNGTGEQPGPDAGLVVGAGVSR